MKYYYFNSRTKAISYVLDLRDFLHGEKRDLEHFYNLKTRREKIIFCEEVNTGYFIFSNKKKFIESLPILLLGDIKMTKVQRDLYRDLRKEILAL